MPEPKSAAGAMGDIIGSTRQRIEHSEDPADRLKNLIAATPKPAPAAAPAPVREPAPTTLPSGYFPQVASEVGIIPKRKPQRGPARSLHISMRLSPPERDRLVRWCDDRNLSLPDGIMALIDLAEGQGGSGE
ncbi:MULTISPECIES: hypothetical protein [Sphingobium]|jgi:hypothetical protein|uniref:Uncharacterized protein n=2 Tax=Sphingobium TaxID=165695 RepID=A0A494WH06_9SPHN|nr:MULTISPECIES: hypothetical protein [Sphingobium]ATP21849.1 hypothetical protein BV87_25680 [Sphingobium yanoikuyae]KMW29236.1 hypothetical protein BV87_15225 [Sphingobium yanoikuyae]NBB40641.1 hypothetical protein [Sphingobium yanoikuyae]QJR06162.1 hypothetical protein HH800_28610 [Sphingobium yanoikuyae]BBE00451.1 hypothetical protein SAMIE_3001570 [Sphingobium amiense]